MKKSKIIVAILLTAIIATTCCLALTACDDRTLDKDYTFAFDPIKTEIGGYTGIPLFFSEDSGLTLSKNGELTLTVIINPSISAVLENVELDLSSLDLNVVAKKYAEPILPWFDITDVKGTFDALEQNLGAKLIIDYEEDATKKLVEAIQTTGKLNPDFTVPATFGLRYTGKYEVKHLVSADGTEYTALYVDKYTEGGEPFIIITLDENEDGLKTALIHVEFLNMRMYFVERAEE